MTQIPLNELQRLFKNSFFLVFSSVFSAVINLLVVSRLSDVLLVDGFGRYNFLLTYSNYFLLLTSLGTDVAAIRLMVSDKQRTQEIYGALVPLKCLLSIGVFALMLTPMLINEKLSSYGWILVIFSSTVLASPFSAQCVFEANKRLEFPSIITTISQITHLILVILFVRKPDDLIIAAVLVLFKNGMVVCSHTFIYIKRFHAYRWNVNRDIWRALIKSGLVIGLIQISVMLLHYLDVFMLNFMKDERAVGLYSAAYRAMFMILTLVAIFNNLMNTLLFETYSVNRDAFKNYFQEYSKVSILGGFCIVTGLIFLAKPYLALFFDMVLYHQSIYCFQILMGSFLFMMICIPLHSGMLAARQERRILKIVSIQVVCNVLGNWFLIPLYGIMGSAVSTVLSELIGFILYPAFFRRIFPVPIYKNIFMAALISTPMAVYLYFSSITTHFLIRGFIGVAIMICTGIIFKVYTLDELKTLKKNLLSFNRQRH